MHVNVHIQKSKKHYSRKGQCTDKNRALVGSPVSQRNEIQTCALYLTKVYKCTYIKSAKHNDRKGQCTDKDYAYSSVLQRSEVQT